MWRNEKEKKKKKICTEVQLLLLLSVFAYSVLNSKLVLFWTPTAAVLFLLLVLLF